MNSTIQLKIDGMTCTSCTGHIEKSLYKVAGVVNVTVNRATETATIQSTACHTELIEPIVEAGYQVAVKLRKFSVGDMSCTSCVTRVEKALLKINGVVSASVNLSTEIVQVNKCYLL